MLGIAVEEPSSYVFLDDLLDEFGDVPLKFHRLFLQSIVNGDFLPFPHNVRSTRLLHRHMVVIFRESPVASMANLRILQLLPIDAVLTRPGLGAICRPTQQHVHFRVVDILDVVSGNFKRYPMVYLELLRIKLLQIDGATTPMQPDELCFQCFSKGRSAVQVGEPRLCGVTKSVRTYLPSVTPSNSECFQRYALFSHIAGRPGWMVVAVFLLQLFSRNVAMRQNVFDNRARPFCPNGLALFYEIRREIICSHLSDLPVDKVARL